MNKELKEKMNNTISILKDLISFSVIGGQSNLPIAEYIVNILKANNIEYHKVFNTTGDKMSIHCRIGPEVDGGIILSGHMDVVTIEGQPWTKPGFSLTHIGDKLYGRGTSDMKGFLACCLAMIPHFKKSILKKPIYLAFSYDEEVGCLATNELLLSVKSQYREKPRFAIIGEPTSMQTVNVEKGAAFFKTSVYSRAAHSSEVRKSISAIEEATYLIQWLLAKMDQFIEQRNVDERFEPPHTTLHVGTIKGGASVNIVADQCEFEWDVRNIPSDTIQKILDSFEAFYKKRIDQKQKTFPDFNIKTKAQFPIVPSLHTPKSSEIVKLVNSFTENTSTNAVSFASEAGYFSQAGFETVVCGPGSMAQGHQADEYIELDQLKKCITFLERVADWSKIKNKAKDNYEKV